MLSFAPADSLFAFLSLTSSWLYFFGSFLPKGLTSLSNVGFFSQTVASERIVSFAFPERKGASSGIVSPSG
jgi:hypothetical protein